MTETESQLQSAVAAVLDAIPGLLWCHVPNEARRSPALGNRLKRSGLKPGVPDVLIWPCVGRYRGIAIELKVGRGRLTTAQSWWIGRLQAAGWSATTARSVDDVLYLLRAEGVL